MVDPKTINPLSPGVIESFIGSVYFWVFSGAIGLLLLLARSLARKYGPRWDRRFWVYLRAEEIVEDRLYNAPGLAVAYVGRKLGLMLGWTLFLSTAVGAYFITRMWWELVVAFIGVCGWWLAFSSLHSFGVRAVILSRIIKPAALEQAKGEIEKYEGPGFPPLGDDTKRF